jgi:hypothetical protein
MATRDVDEDVNEQRRKKFPPLYDLTQFTGKDAHADRGGALFGFIEYSRRHRLIFFLALLPSVFVTALLAPLVGSPGEPPRRVGPLLQHPRRHASGRPHAPG